MTPLTLFITYALSAGVVLLDAFVIFSAVFFIVSSFDKKPKPPISRWLHSHAYLLAFVMASVSLLMSLYYSQIAGFVACELCWWQRLFWYPQVLILAIPLFRKDLRGKSWWWKSIIFLSVIGASIAAFHYYGQNFNASVLPCGITPAQSLCANIPFKTFGYITIPMMSLSGFLAQITLMVWYRMGKHSSREL